MSSKQIIIGIPAIVSLVLVPSAVNERELFSKCKLTEYSKDGWVNDILEFEKVDKNPIK